MKERQYVLPLSRKNWYKPKHYWRRASISSLFKLIFKCRTLWRIRHFFMCPESADFFRQMTHYCVSRAFWVRGGPNGPLVLRSLPTGRAGVGLLRGRRFRRIDECQTIWSFSASLLAIFVTGGPLGANKRFLAVLSKCWQSVVWILLTRIWYRKRAWKSPNGLAKEALLRCGCSLFGFQVWLFRKLKRPEREQP